MSGHLNAPVDLPAMTHHGHGPGRLIIPAPRSFPGQHPLLGNYHVATGGGLDSDCCSFVRYCWLDHSSRLPSAAQREEDIRLIVGERLVGGRNRGFGSCEACLGSEHVQDFSPAEAEQGGRLAARFSGAVLEFARITRHWSPHQRSKGIKGSLPLGYDRRDCGGALVDGCLCASDIKRGIYSSDLEPVAPDF
jgi:hypothetical protein